MIKSKFFGFVALLLLSFANFAKAEDTRPNILVILLDDLGYADVGFMPEAEQDIYTPNIDQLASQGLIMTSAYVTHPFCGPSRAGLMTGRNQHEFGSQFNLAGYSEHGIDLNETFFSELLQQAGYFNGVIGKWHLGERDQYHPNNRGFDYFYGMLGGGHVYHTDDFVRIAQHNSASTSTWDYLIPLRENFEYASEAGYDDNLYITDMLTDAGVNFIEQAEQRDQQPFFLYMSYNAPHTPEQAKAEDEQTLREVLGDNAAQDPKRHTYSAMVYAVDRGVKKLVEKLKQAGEYDNTLIVFLSDNGGRLNNASARNTPLKQGKGATNEGGIRVPMFMSWPEGKLQNGMYTHPVSSLDLYPTFINLAQANKPANKKLDGQDLLNHLRNGTNARPEQPLFFMRHSPNGNGGTNSTAVILNNWKWHTDGAGQWQFYDLSMDIGEESPLPDNANYQFMLDEAYQWVTQHVEPRFFDSPNYGFERGWKNNNMPNFGKTFPARYRSTDFQSGTTSELSATSSSIHFQVAIGEQIEPIALLQLDQTETELLQVSSSNENIIEITDSGMLLAKARGEAEIEITLADSKKNFVILVQEAEASHLGNGDFESNSAFEQKLWQHKGNAGAIQTEVNQGQFAAYLRGQSSLVQHVHLSAQQQYQLSAWGKSSHVEHLLTLSVLPLGGDSSLAELSFSESAYQQKSSTFTAPASGLYRVQLTGAGNSEFNADDVSLIKVVVEQTDPEQEPQDEQGSAAPSEPGESAEQKPTGQNSEQQSLTNKKGSSMGMAIWFLVIGLIWRRKNLFAN